MRRALLPSVRSAKFQSKKTFRLGRTGALRPIEIGKGGFGRCHFRTGTYFGLFKSPEGLEDVPEVRTDPIQIWVYLQRFHVSFDRAFVVLDRRQSGSQIDVAEQNG